MRGDGWRVTELTLCRHIYHCTPSQLAEQDWETVQFHLDLIAVEQRVEKFRKAPSARQGGGAGYVQ